MFKKSNTIFDSLETLIQGFLKTNMKVIALTRLKTSQTGLLHSKMPVNDFYFGAYELLNAIENPRQGGKGHGQENFESNLPKVALCPTGDHKEL